MGGVIEMITLPFFMSPIRECFFLQAYGGIVLLLETVCYLSICNVYL